MMRSDIIANKLLSYGSSGSEVKKLQETLNKKGYNLDVDGQFGVKTQAAVKDYQKKNNLAVDGIVGEKTSASLYQTASSEKATTKTASAATAKTSTKTATTTNRPTYQESDSLKRAKNDLANRENAKPDEYEGKYDERIEAILADILDRGDFSYNLNADPLYEQYRELYTKNGQRAMEDTVGKAAALTGGYGNSYGVTAGSESYQNYLNQLNEVGLDLYDRAYKAYEDKGESLAEQLQLLRGLDSDNYERYRDTVSDYTDERDYLLKKLSTMSDDEYKQFLDEVDAWETDRKFNYEQLLDEIEQEQFREQMDFKKSEAERDQKNKDRSYALSLNKSSGSGSSKSSSAKSSKTTSSASDVYPKTYSAFVKLTGFSGIMTQSEFQKRSSSVEKYGTYEKYLEAMYKKYK